MMVATMEMSVRALLLPLLLLMGISVSQITATSLLRPLLLLRMKPMASRMRVSGLQASNTSLEVTIISFTVLKPTETSLTATTTAMASIKARYSPTVVYRLSIPHNLPNGRFCLVRLYRSAGLRGSLGDLCSQKCRPFIGTFREILL